MIVPRPIFTITASRQSERRTTNAASPSEAMDAIDEFAARGFKIETVLDKTGLPIDPMEVLHQLLEDPSSLQSLD